MERLTRVAPAFVLLGNSMVETRFSERALQRLMPRRRLAVLGLSGSKSAHWYLVLKNSVIPSGARPRVLLFFRPNELTEPRTRAVGNDHRKLETWTPADDPIVERKLAPPWREPSARLSWYRERLAPFGRLREQTQSALDAVSERGSALFWAAAEPEARRSAINELFGLPHLRKAEESDLPAGADRVPSFRSVVQDSLLPDICDLAEKNGVALSFIRVRSRVTAEGGADDPREERYLAALERYVRGRGAEYYDMHDAAWESADMYGNGDHIAPRAKARYMKLFVEHMGHVFH